MAWFNSFEGVVREDTELNVRADIYTALEMAAEYYDKSGEDWGLKVVKYDGDVMQVSLPDGSLFNIVVTKIQSATKEGIVDGLGNPVNVDNIPSEG